MGATSRKQKHKAKWTLENARKYEQFLPLPRNGEAFCANGQQCVIKKEYFGEQIFNVSLTCECLWRPYWVCYFVDVCVTGSKVCLTQGCATKDGNGGTQNTTTHTSIPCWRRFLSLPHRLANNRTRDDPRLIQTMNPLSKRLAKNLTVFQTELSMTYKRPNPS